MRTDLKQLHGRTFDLVVVGAGVHGAAIARDAAVRGVQVLLVDAGDLAADASAAAAPVVDGALADLRRGRVGAARDELRERERLLRAAPHLVRPLPTLVPFFGDSARAPWALRLGAWLGARLGGRSTLPRPRARTKEESLAAFPGLRSSGLRAGLEVFDVRTDDARLTLANVQDAVAAGAVFCSYTAVVGCDDQGVTLRGEQVEASVRCPVFVNAAGSAADDVRRVLGVEGRALVRVCHGRRAVLPPRAGELALCAFLPDGRAHYLIPFEGGTLCGAADVGERAGRAAGPLPAADLAYLLEPGADLGAARAVRSRWCALPDDVALRGVPMVAERARCGQLYTVAGGSPRALRSLAERAVAQILGLALRSPTRSRPLPGGAGPREVDDPLWWRHGSAASQLREMAGRDPGLAAPLCAHRPFLAVEVAHAVRHQGAVTFADVMLRRLVDVRGPCLEPECLARALEVFLQAGGQVDDRDLAIREVEQQAREVRGDLGAASEVSI